MQTNRITRVLLALLVAGVWANLTRTGSTPVTAQSQEPRTMTLDEITVKRLNVVEESGKPRIVIANGDRMPLPVLGGREWPRSIDLAGVVFYRENGDECGGIGLADLEGVSRQVMIFDYVNSEAIGMGVTEVTDGVYSSGISITDRLPLDADVAEAGTTGTERIAISNLSGVASLVLNDPQGRARLRLSVDDAGYARIEILDAEGNTLYSAPEG